MITLLVGLCNWTLVSAQNVGRRWRTPWRVTEAPLRFRIEKDLACFRVPDIHLSELKPIKGSAPRRSYRLSGGENKVHFRVNGKIYTNGAGVNFPAGIVFPLRKEYDRFVALAGVEDRTDDGAYAVFEVYANEKLLYKSERLTRNMPPVEINVKIPSGLAGKRLRLITTGSVKQRRRWAVWINAGFLIRARQAQASVVKIWTPGYDPTKFDVVVVSGTGVVVNSRASSLHRGTPIEVIFDTSKGGLVYYVYLTPRSGKGTNSRLWEPKAGLVLETRRTAGINNKCHKLPGLVKLWHGDAEFVHTSLINSIHHAFPIHRPTLTRAGKPIRQQGGLGIYYCTGFFRTDRPGQYTFATASHWGSYLFVDDKLVTSWPGRHDHWPGRRGRFRGHITLQPGVHKLEYINCSPWGRMFISAAWQRPQDEKLYIMTKGDFLPVGCYTARSIGYRKTGAGCGGFKWRVIDDLRWDREDAPLVAMEFTALPAENRANYSYRWSFDDDTTEIGPAVEHVFLQPGMRTVSLEIMTGQTVIGKVTEEVYVHALWDKVSADLKSTDNFEKAIFQDDLDLVPVDELISLYRFAEGINQTTWKQRTAAVLTQRIDELIEDKKNGRFCLDLGRDLRSIELRRYEEALMVFSQLGLSGVQTSAVRYLAKLAHAELLLYYFGKADQSRELLRQLGEEKNPDDKTKQRRILLYAESLVALGRIDEARRTLRITPRLSEKSKLDKPKKSRSQEPENSEETETERDDEGIRNIRHLGLLRRSRQIVENGQEPDQLEYALENIDTIVREAPLRLLWPSLNLVRLDIYLARREYFYALRLCERLDRLELNEQERAEVMARQVETLCGMRNMEEARTVYEKITKDYPYSFAVSRARKAIVEAAGLNK